jgi:hypothetical protein
VTFKIVVHNDGDCPLFDIYVHDVMHDSLKYISSNPDPDDYFYDPPYYFIHWLFHGPLMPDETIEINITAHVEGPECSTDFNSVNVSGTCEHGIIELDSDYAYVHAIKKSREINRPFLRLLQRHLNLFRLMEKLLQRLELQ